MSYLLSASPTFPQPINGRGFIVFCKGRALSLEEAAALAHQPLLSGRPATSIADPSPALVSTRRHGDDVLELRSANLTRCAYP